MKKQNEHHFGGLYLSNFLSELNKTWTGWSIGYQGSKNGQNLAYTACTCKIDCPLSKGNQAATPKIERPNGKNTKSKIFLKSVKNWCGQLT